MLRDAQGAPLALIDRNFSGFAKEIFSDAGRYCIHFGQAPDDAARFVQRSIDAHANTDTPKEQLRARVVESNGAIIPFSSGEQLVVKEPLDFNERLIALAAVRFFNSLITQVLPLTHTQRSFTRPSTRQSASIMTTLADILMQGACSLLSF